VEITDCALTGSARAMAAVNVEKTDARLDIKQPLDESMCLSHDRGQARNSPSR
jgi:hypothetical protein